MFWYTLSPLSSVLLFVAFLTQLLPFLTFVLCFFLEVCRSINHVADQCAIDYLVCSDKLYLMTETCNLFGRTLVSLGCGQ